MDVAHLQLRASLWTGMLPEQQGGSAMRVLVLAVAGVLCAASAQAQYKDGGGGAYGTGSSSSSHGTSDYTTPQGTYVQPHQQTSPNGTQYDNYNSRGNYNPYSGQTGNRSPKY
jgi:hypothetical protein